MENWEPGICRGLQITVAKRVPPLLLWLSKWVNFYVQMTARLMENASMAPAFVAKTSQLRIAQYPFTKSQQYPGKRTNERANE